MIDVVLFYSKYINYTNLDYSIFYFFSGIQFNCHKTVLMTTSRYFDTMLTMFDERSKSEVELKDFVDPNVMALSLHFIYDGHMPNVRKRILTQKNVHDILHLAIYLQIQALQSHCCR